MSDLQVQHNSKVTLPQRSKRYGVGKEIAGKVYVHRDYADRLGDALEQAATRLPEDFAYTIVKYDTRSGAVSFILCPDFDTVDEPTVGDVVTVSTDGTARHRPRLTDPQIYHHKWLFVADDYTGFDVATSKRRSESWLALDDVDKSRIGTRSYWDVYVVPRIGSGLNPLPGRLKGT